MNNQFGPLLPYFQYVEAANESLAGVKNFCFYPGMLFKSREKWWPDSGIRPTEHEGVDICYYIDKNGKEQKFTPNTKIPVMAEGEVFAFCKDFLAHSVFIDHGISDSLRLLSVYAHIVSLPNLAIGQEVKAGEVVGMVADTTGRKNRIPAHVHISLLRLPLTVPADMLDWNYICHSDQVSLIDPLSMITSEAVKIKTNNHWKKKE